MMLDVAIISDNDIIPWMVTEKLVGDCRYKSMGSNTISKVMKIDDNTLHLNITILGINTKIEEKYSFLFWIITNPESKINYSYETEIAPVIKHSFRVGIDSNPTIEFESTYVKDNEINTKISDKILSIIKETKFIDFDTANTITDSLYDTDLLTISSDDMENKNKISCISIIISLIMRLFCN